MSDLLKALNDSGALATLLGLILTGFVIPLIQQGRGNAKNAKTAKAYDVLDQLAESAVTYMSTQYEKSSGLKHDQAVQLIETQLAKKGIKSIDSKDINMAIEKAYQYFTAQDTKSQAKQAEFNEGLKNADKVSKAVTPETSNVESESDSVDSTDGTENTNSSTDDEVAKWTAVRDQLNDLIAEHTKGSDTDA